MRKHPWLSRTGTIPDSVMKDCKTLYYEFDLEGDLQNVLSAQFAFINNPPHPLLRPSAIVYTGNKSLHCYIKLDDWMDAKGHKKLQQKLTKAIGSDPAITGAGGLMRAPGTQHPASQRVACWRWWTLIFPGRTWRSRSWRTSHSQAARAPRRAPPTGEGGSGRSGPRRAGGDSPCPGGGAGPWPATGR